MYFALSELTCLFSFLELEMTPCKLHLSGLNFLFSLLELLASILKSGHSGRASRNQLYFGLTITFSLFFFSLVSNLATEGNYYLKVVLCVLFQMFVNHPVICTNT